MTEGGQSQPYCAFSVLEREGKYILGKPCCWPGHATHSILPGTVTCSEAVQSGPHVSLPFNIGKLLVGLSDLVSLWNSVLVGKKSWWK